MFKLIAKDQKARRGQLKLHNGTVETPVFMPVGTLGSVKSLINEDLIGMNAEIMLANTYHLFLRPGMPVIKAHKGLHSFMKWDRPILTDSGGFQIFSLGSNVKLTEEGASFASHLDGKKFTLTPEDCVNIQETLGSDIQMVLDECPPHPISHHDAEKSLELTSRWAKRARLAKTRDELKQFGICQGSVFPDLRKKSIEQIVELNFDGHAIGGLSVGEEKKHMRDMTELSCSLLPEDKPRYLMGVGTPLDLIESVAMGVDMFDCVMPTRNGRNGCLFTSTGRIQIKNSRYQFDLDPLDDKCSCHTCQNYSRSYLRHLFIAGELTALRLFSLHNLTFYLNLMKTIREKIVEGTFSEFLKEQRNIWDK